MERRSVDPVLNSHVIAILLALANELAMWSNRSCIDQFSTSQDYLSLTAEAEISFRFEFETTQIAEELRQTFD